MKFYVALSPAEKDRAFAAALQHVLTEICAGRLQFPDTQGNERVQERIDDAIEQVSVEEAPWFAVELVYAAAKSEVDVLARDVARTTFYLDPGERAIYLGEQSATVEQPHASTVHAGRVRAT